MHDGLEQYKTNTDNARRTGVVQDGYGQCTMDLDAVTGTEESD